MLMTVDDTADEVDSTDAIITGTSVNRRSNGWHYVEHISSHAVPLMTWSCSWRTIDVYVGNPAATERENGVLHRKLLLLYIRTWVAHQLSSDRYVKPKCIWPSSLLALSGQYWVLNNNKSNVKGRLNYDESNSATRILSRLYCRVQQHNDQNSDSDSDS